MDSVACAREHESAARRHCSGVAFRAVSLAAMALSYPGFFQYLVVARVYIVLADHVFIKITLTLLYFTK